MTKAGVLAAAREEAREKFCEKKVGRKGEAGGEADTVDIGNGPETPNLRHQN